MHSDTVVYHDIVPAGHTIIPMVYYKNYVGYIPSSLYAVEISAVSGSIPVTPPESEEPL